MFTTHMYATVCKLLLSSCWLLLQEHPRPFVVAAVVVELEHMRRCVVVNLVVDLEVDLLRGGVARADLGRPSSLSSQTPKSAAYLLTWRSLNGRT